MDQLEVKILERVFKLQVPEAEKPRLMEAVRLVNAALQLAYEFLGQDNAPSVPPQVSSKITQMSEELEVEIRRQENLF